MPAHPRAHRRPRGVLATLAAVASATALLLGAPAAADPACVPDGSTQVQVVLPELADVGPLTVGLVARDSCGAFDPGFAGAVELLLVQVDGRTTEPGVVEFEAQDEGEVRVEVLAPRTGLVHVVALDATSGEELGWETVLVGPPGGEPVLDGFELSTVGGVYRASGAVVDPDEPAGWRSVSVVVDVTPVRRVDAAHFFPPWDDAPDAVGAAHGFDVELVLPTGRHAVCLVVTDVVRGGQGTRPHTLRCDVVQGPPPAGVAGGYDGLYRVPAGVVAAGWAVDPGAPGGVALVQTATGYTFPGGRTFAPTGWVPAVTVTGSRPDVAARYPDLGADHGFVSDSVGAGHGTVVEVCVRAGGTGLGCRSTTLRRSPVGALDQVSPAAGGALVRGWALDEDTYAPASVHVQVDGRPAVALQASRHRADLAAAFGPGAGGLVPGYGGGRGFEGVVPMAAGRHTVCAYAIDVAAHLGSSNTALGCREVVVPDGSPLGRVDAVVPAPGGVVLRGWAADPDAPTTPLAVHVYRDGAGAAVVRADAARPDLLALEGGRFGSRHGFAATVPTGERARLCTYALNLGAGGTRTLECRLVTRSLVPSGALDAVARVGAGVVEARGWALDPDVAAPIGVHAYVDGRFAAAARADAARDDVARAHPGWGAGHGYAVRVPAAAGAQVCLYGLNAGAGTSSTLLGCRTA